MQTSDAAPKCSHCGSLPHAGVCPTIKAIEYHPDGSIKRIEYKGMDDLIGRTAPIYSPIMPAPIMPYPVTCDAPAFSKGYSVHSS